MPLLRDVLIKQAGIPGNIEKNLPTGAPKVSQLMANIATALPVNPSLPELPMGPGATFQSPGVTAGLIRGVEEPIPPGPPSLSETKVKVVPPTSTQETIPEPRGGEILS